jgi:single-strand DNA-binding protein
MARDLNHSTLVGRLVRDPEVRYSASGVAIAKISVANNDAVKKDNQWQDEVSYFDVVIFGNQAVNCEKYLKKGSQVAIEGRLKQNRWVDQASGQNRSKVEIVASSVQFLTVKEGSQAPVGTNSNSDNNHIQNDPWSGKQQDDDDVPF